MNIDLFDYYIGTHEVQIQVTHYHHQERDFNADNSDDFYGFTDIEYDALDMDGNPASIFPNRNQDEAIRNEIHRRMQEEKASDFDESYVEHWVND